VTPSRAIGLTIMVGLLLVGCGKHYWNRAGAGANDFSRDSGECARQNALDMSANKDYAIIQPDLYKACLKSRGWVRAQHHDLPADWFRGIESDEPVKLAPSAQTQPEPRSDLPATPSEVVADLVGTWAGQLTRPSLDVRGFDLKGSGDVVSSGSTIRLSGMFGQQALPISFTLAMSGSVLGASGIGADNMLYRLGRRDRRPC